MPSQIDPALEARENYIRGIQTSGITDFKNFSKAAAALSGKSSHRLLMICVFLPGWRAVEANTMAHYVLTKAWLHREYAFFVVKENGCLGSRYYMGREIDMEPKKSLEELYAELENFGKKPKTAKRKTVKPEDSLEGIYASIEAKARAREFEAIPLPPEALRRAIEQAPMAKPKINPAPLWWEIEREAERDRRKLVIALRNDLRQIIGTHNPL